MSRVEMLLLLAACLAPLGAEAQPANLFPSSTVSPVSESESRFAAGPLDVVGPPPVGESILRALPALDAGGDSDGGQGSRSADQERIGIVWSPTQIGRGTSGFDWNTYLKQNAHMLAWQHGYRILVQEKTRAGLREPLLSQWGANITSIPERWGDGDSFVTNYLGHPYMGSIMGFLQVANHPVHARLEIGDPGYWQARSAALAASAVASTQFEIGPVSEASLGLDPSRQGLVDFVITPLLGTGFLVVEDALDKYVIARFETRNSFAKRFMRCALNPGRMAANLFAFRAPWHRDTR